ncbi:arginase family protein [Paenibacillus spongiae]|uniref:Arginase family protein n=1 Tax=Paenibacillus spongiae TaxID=2909671 RepID=A0ABY5S394_9BACL|nr:arginase family protein [Paenibacillus spongiae]UVI28040.1 arginase family protein [Paenibacillus spongiae]
MINAFFSKRTPLILGGDHSISIATISAAAGYVKEELQSDKLGVIWVDAHADLSDWDHGKLHGKIAVILLGLGSHEDLINMGGFSPKLLPQHLIYIGLSDLMPNEYRISQSPKFIGADFVEFSPEDVILHNTNELTIKLIDAAMGYRM